MTFAHAEGLLSVSAGKGLILEPLGGPGWRLCILVEHMRQPLARLIGLTLARPQAGIETAPREQLNMRALLDDLAMVEHDDIVGMDDG